MEQPFKQVRDIFARLIAVPQQQEAAEEENYTLERRSQPDALMTLFLCIRTERGPRTLISSGVTLEVASEIAQEMAAAGHSAAFVDQFPQIPMAERLSRRKYKKEFSGVAALDRLKRNYR
jgi:hypothetical protein